MMSVDDPVTGFRFARFELDVVCRELRLQPRVFGLLEPTERLRLRLSGEVGRPTRPASSARVS